MLQQTTGGMGTEAEIFVKQLAKKMTMKDQSSDYSNNMSFVRRRLRFDLLRTTLIAIRGFRGKLPSITAAQKIKELDFDMERSVELVDM